MNKKLLYLLFLFFLNLASAQQNEEFRKVKDYYDYQKFMLNNSFKKKFEEEQDTFSKLVIKKDFDEFMKKMDSIQNVAFIGALIKVRNNEDLGGSKIFSIPAQTKNKEINKETAPKITSSENLEDKEVLKPEYPGGIDSLRKQIAEIFYYDAMNNEQKSLKTSIAFVVERDGSISSVHAEGENFVMNRQAEIAVYQLPDKFSPAKLKGTNVRYRFRLPITMNFE